MSILWHKFAKSLLILGSCVYLGGPLLAAPSKLESNSPFLPPGYSKLKSTRPKPVQNPNSPIAKDLEFRGVVQLNGAYQFSMFKKSENRGYWIPEDGSENGITVSDFNADSMSITVTASGRSEQLSLMTASENPLPVVAGSPSATSASPPFPPNIQTPNNTRKNQPTRRTIPRRRVILPPKK